MRSFDLVVFRGLCTGVVMSEKDEVFLAFFKAKRGNFIDKLIGVVDGSEYSHVELVILRKKGLSTYYDCFSSHVADGGVRTKQMLLNGNKWDLIPVPDTVDLVYAFEFFKENARGKYDYLGLFTTILNWWPHGKKRWFCSELIAAMLQLPHPERTGIKKLYNLYK